MSRSAEEIRDWIVARVAELTGLPPAEVDAREPVARLGLDSVAAITLAADLETWLGYRFRENPFDDHPTIEKLARFLAGQLAPRPGPGGGQPGSTA